uniref:Uncharacterized protein n=1 Tax=Moniliophthora roreri TaxID=221103 RepID=A0A0W0FW78_MONRR
MPFRILICSRPEPAIRDAFNTDRFRAYLCRVALDDSFSSLRDIGNFLWSEFERIRTSPHYQHIPFPFPWPAPGVIYELAQKASGQFIYAKTVVKFVDNEYFNPCEQLECILHPKIDLDPESNSPFHDLDMLYHQILSSNPRHSKVRDVMRALLSAALLDMSSSRTPRTIEDLLLLQEGDVLSILCGMHSILRIGGPYDEILILHASFGDFLRDLSRSGYFFVGNDEDIHGFLAYRYLRVIDHWPQVFGGNREVLTQEQPDVFYHAWRKWGYHCSKSNLNDDVLDALRAVVRQNSNSMKSLGSYITACLCDENPWRMARMTRTFLCQAGVTLQRLRANPSNRYADMMQRLSDCRRGFLFQADQPVSKSLNNIINCLSHSLITDTTMTALPQLSGKVISIGNDCSCTQAEEATSLLFLPCSESTFRNVYHIQLSVAMVKWAGVVMCNSWHTPTLLEVLVLCDPCPELLELVPLLITPLITGIESGLLQDTVLKWLQSSPSEYESQTLPLIEQIHQYQS